MTALEDRLKISELGGIEEEPLIEFGFRFYPIQGCWRTVGKKGRCLTKRVSSQDVASAVGISLNALARWEAAKLGLLAKKEPTNQAAFEVSPGNTVNKTAPLQWGFEYFPVSRTWRRARASRNEVDRSLVAKKIGISESVLAIWESAVHQNLENNAA